MEVIKVDNGGMRLDTFLTEHFAGGVTRSQIANCIKSGKVLLSGQVVKAGAILRAGDTINCEIESSEMSAEPEQMHIDIVYEDEHLMIINKPRGLVVHPGAGNKRGTLLNGLLGLAQSMGVSAERQNIDRAGIVHRLDKNTAGLMVAAKTAEAQARLGEMFERHAVKRTYVGLVEGSLRGEGTVDRNIIRDPNHRTLFKTTAQGGRRAVTHYRVLKNLALGGLSGAAARVYSLVEFNLETGRTHQIRVHCKSINHPLVGDAEYNPNSSIKAGGQLLESVCIAFIHPITNKNIEISIGETSEFANILSKLVQIS